MSQSAPERSEPVLRRGDTGPGVADVREILVSLGLLQEPDHQPAAPVQEAEYDNAVELAVRHFQQVRGLSVDGRVGRETYDAMISARWRFGDRLLHNSVTRLMHGDDVMTLQERLIGLGYDAGKPDGVFGAATERALRGFQADYGLTADGTCGPVTIRALRQLDRGVRGGRPQLLRQESAFVSSGPHLFGKRVVIDPGHGGPDKGYFLGETTEADLTWDIASRIEGQLGAAGGTAYLTRGRRGNPTTKERAALANSTDADLLISLHVEFHPSPHARGIATYYFGTGSGAGPGSSVGETFAGMVGREVVSRTGLLECGTHPKSWDLLRLTRMPAVRMDIGYLSHPVDRRLLLDARFRSTIAQATVAAIQRLYLPQAADYRTGALEVQSLRR
ncbi:MAG: N-acetylmuramoyl-L-alanine amidase [Actinomycetota bacterium]|nr:N-acetylmuramoyl-L-alanine amidase [Actinomycetota bacterium]